MRGALEAGRAAPEIVVVRLAGLEAALRHEDPTGRQRLHRRGSTAATAASTGSDPVDGGLADGGLVDGGLTGGRGVHGVAAGALLLLQEFLAEERFQDSRLVFLSDRALAVVEGEAPNLSQAAVVGLLRSARSEHPGRLVFVDTDESGASLACLPGTLARGGQEPEIALREGVLYIPRIARVKAEPSHNAEHSPAERSLEEHGGGPGGTVLITGGTGGLGALVAGHLVERGARDLLLASRSGMAAVGAVELKAALEERGARVQIVACDVADRSQLQALIAGIPEDRPLRSVVHTAGVFDDGVIASLDAERLARVMAPKVNAAINLHELAGDAELIFFSSIAGVWVV